MSPRNQLTNEKLRGLFKNNFELANQAITLARYFIKSGREVNVDELLEEVRRNPSPSYLEDLKKAEQEDANEEAAGS